MASPTRPAYGGLRRKLVIAIDVGTTFSGVCYSILDPGEIPEIRAVLRYPGQEKVGDTKIPTLMWYDQSGSVQAAGAEATRSGIAIDAEEQQWIKSEWFKVYLRPKAIDAPGELHKIPPLPLGKTVVEVFADFLRYIYECTKTYIRETHSNGKAMWDSFEDEIDFVLTHPNGYEGPQQSVMREAAVLAGLVPDQDASNRRVQLVTEGEASLHYCLQSGLSTDVLKQGKGLMVIDAGGGTIDFSSYVQNGESFEEIAAPECLYSGSVFVTSRARIFFENLLANTRFSEDVDLITERFDNNTKPSFNTDEDDYWIQFAAVREKDPKLNIRSGQLKISGSDVASFFERSISDIVTSVDEQTFSAKTEITSAFLVGGFATSDWLYSRIQERLDLLGIEVSRPDSGTSKAVAHGAVSYYLDHRVTTRVSKVTYGVPCSVPYDPTNDEHIKRASSKYRSAAGVWYIPGAFDVILPRNIQVAETKEFRRSFGRTRPQASALRKVTTSIMCYRGDIEKPVWVDVEPEKFTSMGNIEADLGELTKTLKPHVTINDGGEEETYYSIDFDIALLFGMTEFKALVIWQENGEEKRNSAVKVKFNPEEVE
ncbi:hypothetical protein GALMADRAFT_910351 [Galerina marginata CBS 339.88]|uniref:Uncharacterized protein n=1 Tax=Galerina marginata (strain CBS 339.88) TaxID=685588 RepID=A0A067SIH5_GALM3|nr:hypothetical protein GALMADRAFT_910351 [Galerina marginata CBS 339.88]